MFVTVAREISGRGPNAAEISFTRVTWALDMATSVPVPMGDADVGSGPARGVIDAVAGHRDVSPSASVEPPVGPVLWTHLAMHIIEPQLARDGVAVWRLSPSPWTMRRPSACRAFSGGLAYCP